MNYSVALCSYNGAEFIEEQLLSILNQSIPPNEIVICDDCSTDSTVVKIEKTVSKNPQISWNIQINPSNLGYVQNFEKAISLSTNELIFLADQDDIWVDNKAERILEVFSQKHNCSVIFSDALIVNNNLESLGGTMFQKIEFTQVEQATFYQDNFQLQLLLNRSICTGATMAIKKSFVKQLFPFPSSQHFIHDAWIATLSAYLGRLHFINEPLILYRQHANQSIGALKQPEEVVKTKIDMLNEHLQRSYLRESLVYETIVKSPELIRHGNYSFVQSRVKLLSDLLNDNHSFSKRLRKFSISPFSKKLPEFNSLRKFMGNWFIYLFNIK